MLHPLVLLLFLELEVFLFRQVQGYEIVDDFSGATFFDEWEFYGNLDNVTSGDVWWLNRTQALDQGLISTNAAGNTIIKVDDASEVALNERRNSVRIMTQRTYDVGSVWIADVLRMPFGCSVWTSFGSTGGDAPNNGEINIIEGINLMDRNQISLRTREGCVYPTEPEDQLGVSGDGNCNSASGCTVFEQKRFSYGRDFGGSGGGVFAAQFERSGIFIWYWPRGLLPASIYFAAPTSPMTLDDWGLPTASYRSIDTCNTTEFFGPQRLVLSINLCGAWASMPELYLPQCAGESGENGTCYADNVVGSGERYSNAYFEIPYVRTYTTREGMPPPSTATVSSPTVPTTTPASDSEPGANEQVDETVVDGGGEATNSRDGDGAWRTVGGEVSGTWVRVASAVVVVVGFVFS